MTRLKTYGADNTWQRLYKILDWFARVQAEGAYREHYYDSTVYTRGTLQGGGTAGGLGMDFEFYESVLVPQIMIRGFLGFEPKIDGFAINPKLPSIWPSLTINRIRLNDTILSTSATGSSIFVSIDGGNDILKIYPPYDRWEIKYFDSSSNVINNFTTFINENNESIPLRSEESEMVELTRKPMLNNFSFEDNGIEITYPGYVANNPVDSWNFSTVAAGRNTSDGPFFGSGKTPDGHNVCFIQSLGGVSQTVSGFETGENYKLSLFANAAQSGSGTEQLELKFGGVSAIGPISVSPVGGNNFFQEFSANFSAASTNLTLEISQANANADSILLIDDIRITKINKPYIPNHSFEANGVTGFTWPGYDAAIDNWTKSTAGIGRNTMELAPFFDNGSIPDGQNVCFIQNPGYIRQTISGFEENWAYTLSLKANSREGTGGKAGLEVKLNGTTILGPVEVTSVGDYNQFHTFSNGFLSPGAESFELQIHQTYDDGGGVNSLTFDDIKITGIPIPEPGILWIVLLIPPFLKRVRGIFLYIGKKKYEK